MAAGATKCTEVAAAAAGAAPNIGRGRTGCGVGIDAFASPIAAPTIMPVSQSEQDFFAKHPQQDD